MGVVIYSMVSRSNLATCPLPLYQPGGSRGSYTAAVAGVAAAIKGVDMILGGQCVNAFCATRPPGHHAGRELHPMKAISNGFCILNTVACAALYATTPLSEHGPGLKRVSQSGMRLTLAPRMDVTPLFILVRANRHSFCSCYFRFASLTLMSTMETELKVSFNSLRKKKKKQ
jgi:hypothetical protein